MRLDTRRRLEDSVRALQALHPMPRYVEDVAEELSTVGVTALAVHPPPARLVDLGCGALDKTGLMALLGYSCAACDDYGDAWHQDAERMDSIRAFAQELRIDLRITDVCAVPWPDATFDVATIVYVIEHLNVSPREILNTAGRLLRRDGVLIVVVPNAVNLRKRLSVLVGRSNFPDLAGFYETVGPWRGRVREFTMAEAIDLIRWNGFELIEARMFHGAMRRRITNRSAQLVYRALCRLQPTLMDSIVVAARKPASWQPRAANLHAFHRSVARFVPPHSTRRYNFGASRPASVWGNHSVPHRMVVKAY